jgi:hypothetical protein
MGPMILLKPVDSPSGKIPTEAILMDRIFGNRSAKRWERGNPTHSNSPSPRGSGRNARMEQGQRRPLGPRLKATTKHRLPKRVPFLESQRNTRRPPSPPTGRVLSSARWVRRSRRNLAWSTEGLVLPCFTADLKDGSQGSQSARLGTLWRHRRSEASFRLIRTS